MASWAMASIVLGVLPVVAPTPTLSNVTTRRFAASASMRAGSQLSRLPRKCCSRTSGTSPSPSRTLLLRPRRFWAEPLEREEGMRAGDERAVVVEAEVAPPFVVVEAELALELAVVEL